MHLSPINNYHLEVQTYAGKLFVWQAGKKGELPPNYGYRVGWEGACAAYKKDSWVATNI